MNINSILAEMRKGKTTDELAKEFSDILNQAETRRQAELEAEAKRNAKLANKREAMRLVIKAVNDYFSATNQKDKMVEDEIDNNTIDLLCKVFDNLTFTKGDPFSFYKFL